MNMEENTVMMTSSKTNLNGIERLGTIGQKGTLL
jgi:hypothetical protein